jgi:hypothetical protein
MAHVVRGSVHGADEYGEDLVLIVLDPGEAVELTALLGAVDRGDLVDAGLSGLAEAMYEAVGGAA